MPRIFWTLNRKRKLLEQSKTMTVNQMAKYHLQPVVEIERMLLGLNGNKSMIKRVYKEGKIKVTVYYAAYAAGVRGQIIGEHFRLI